jgi:lipopolysaccharide/colanic/teichoic acid biosynthesis glycosyltransferase
MMRPSGDAARRRVRSLPELLDLVLIATGFSAMLAVCFRVSPDAFSEITSNELAEGMAASVIAVWIGSRMQRHGGADSSWQFFLEQLCFAVGLNLIVQALLAYVFVFSLPATLTMPGCFVAVLLLTLARAWTERRPGDSDRGVLLVGYDAIAREIVAALRLPVLGFVDDRKTGEAGLQCLGDISQLEEVVGKRQPGRLLIGIRDWVSHISPIQLLRYRQQGIVVDHAPDLYERVLRRVCSGGLEPADLLLSPALQADSRAMALQAIYTNVIGLVFLLAASPVMILVSICVALFSGGWPVFETVPCLGFQKIPFLLLRFRTTRKDDGGMSAMGRLITALHLVNLPQLLNVVRGDMALFGPRPVRHAFAARLTRLMPFYSHRFSVKPGVLGWAQMHAPWAAAMEESRQIEYDLYYVKEGSPLLDCEIFLRMLLGGVKPEASVLAQQPSED